MRPDIARAGTVVGRYVLLDRIASGGMAAVHLGRLAGPSGFARTVAIKRLHPHLAAEPEFVTMLLDEARMASRVQHPNVVDTLDVVAEEGELFLVMEYVHGESLATLLKLSPEGDPPLSVLSAVVSSALHGLHAAHEAKSALGEPLGIVHRDVSPQNVIVGVDGHARMLDFGVAKAAGRLQTTREGQLKGKVSYMAPEQLTSDKIDRRADVYAMAVVLWEGIARRRLFKADSDARTLHLALTADVAAPSTLVAGLPEGLDAIVLRGLARDPAGRFDTARDMATALEQCVPPALPAQVAEWVTRTAGKGLAERAARIAEIEREGSEPSGSAPRREGSTAHAAAQSEVTSVLTDSAVVTGNRRQASGARRTVGIWIAAGTTLATVVAAAVLLVSRGHAATSAPAASPLASTPSAEPSTAPAPSASAPAPAPSAEPSEPPPASVAPSTPPRRRPPAPSVDCSPPYIVDAEGHRIYKRGCLRP